MKVAIAEMKNSHDCSEIAAMGAISLMPDKLNSVQSNRLTVGKPFARRR
jgi:hypothetical protein